MIIFGKPLSEYVSFCKWFLILIPVTGIARLALSLEGTPSSTARWFSMTALVWIAVVYLSVRVHTTGFGSFKQLLVLCALVNLSAQVVAIFGIVLAILTDTNNIFSVPEAFFGSDGKTWLHVGAHLTVGTFVAPLLLWLVGSVILAATRKLSAPSRATTDSLVK
jgi:hypothetical protein